MATLRPCAVPKSRSRHHPSLQCACAGTAEPAVATVYVTQLKNGSRAFVAAKQLSGRDTSHISAVSPFSFKVSTISASCPKPASLREALLAILHTGADSGRFAKSTASSGCFRCEGACAFKSFPDATDWWATSADTGRPLVPTGGLIDVPTIGKAPDADMRSTSGWEAGVARL
jgi:hypothetical protein